MKNLNHILLSLKSQLEKATYCMIPALDIEEKKSTDSKKDYCCPWFEGRKEGWTGRGQGGIWGLVKFFSILWWWKWHYIIMCIDLVHIHCHIYNVKYWLKPIILYSKTVNLWSLGNNNIYQYLFISYNKCTILIQNANNRGDCVVVEGEHFVLSA